MAKILWKRICEQYVSNLPVLIWCSVMAIFNGVDQEIAVADMVVFGVIILAMVAALVLGGLSSEPIQGVFITPFSREDRRRLVIKLFYGKIAVGAAVMAVVSVIALLLGSIKPVNGFTMCIIVLAMEYMISFRKFYEAKDRELRTVLQFIFLIADILIFIGACQDEFLFLGRSNGVVLMIIAVVLAAVQCFVVKKDFKPMVECYSDYEKMTEAQKKRNGD